MTLRIERLAGGERPTIVLHGWLSAAEVPEFERTVSEMGMPLRIELGQLADVDLEGRLSLCRHQRRGVHLSGALPYISLLLERTSGGLQGEPDVGGDR